MHGRARSKQNAGLCLSELLVAICLAALLLGALAAALRHAAGTSSVVLADYRRVFVRLRIQSLLRAAALDLDSHRLPLLPRVHENAICFADGSDNSSAYGSSPPQPGSNAISSVRLKLPALHDVRDRRDEGEYKLFRGCPRYRPWPDLSEFDSYLGISVDGMLELAGSADAARGPAHCRNFRLRAPAHSMLHGSDQLLDPEGLLVLIPIAANYTLYLDRRDQLRYVQHRGAETRENQPLVSGIGQLRFSLTPLAAALLVAAELRFPGGQSTSTAAANRLGRLTPWPLLFNRS